MVPIGATVVSQGRLKLVLHRVRLNQALLHLLFKLVQAASLPLVDALVGGLHLARPELFHRLAGGTGFVEPLLDVFNVGLLGQLSGYFDPL